MIYGIHARNRALHGDVVAVKLLPKSQWTVSSIFRIEDDDISNHDDIKTFPVDFCIIHVNTEIFALYMLQGELRFLSHW